MKEIKLPASSKYNKTDNSSVWGLIGAIFIILLLFVSFRWTWIYNDEMFGNPHRTPAEIKVATWSRFLGHNK